MSSSFFSVDSENCKTLIFTRRRYNHCPDNTYNGNTIPLVTNHVFLGLNMDSKLRWSPYINDMTKFTEWWPNFLRSIVNTWWGSHPTTLLLLYKSIIRAKLNYGCFFLGSSSNAHNSKLQISCLRFIIDALKSTLSPAIQLPTLKY